MIRAYQDSDLQELLEVWYQASVLAHPFLDEAFLSRVQEALELDVFKANEMGRRFYDRYGN